MRKATLTDDEIRTLLVDRQPVTVPCIDEAAYDRMTMVTFSAHLDPDADVHITPHHLYDAEIDGAVIVRSRSGRELIMRVPKKGHEYPFAAPRSCY